MSGATDPWTTFFWFMFVGFWVWALSAWIYHVTKELMDD